MRTLQHKSLWWTKIWRAERPTDSGLGQVKGVGDVLKTLYCDNM